MGPEKNGAVGMVARRKLYIEPKAEINSTFQFVPPELPELLPR